MSEGKQEKLSPLVSVIINNFNKGKYLKRCLNSIYNQTYNNIELVFWDDNSTDDSLDVFNIWCATRKGRLGRSVKFGTTKQLSLHSVPGFVPLGVTRWLALQMCTGKYVAICDSDDWWDIRKLNLQLYHSNSGSRNWGLSFTNCCIATDGEGENLSIYSLKYPSKKYKDNYYKGLLTKYNFIAASTIVFDRERLLSVLGPPTHYTSGEDYDWILKVVAKYEVAYNPLCLSFYNIVGSSLTHSKRSSTRATWYEIDAVISSYRREGKYKYSVICHLVKLYAKLLWKQFVREKL